MPILPIDAGRYGTDAMKEVFDDQKKILYQLEIEAAVSSITIRDRNDTKKRSAKYCTDGKIWKNHHKKSETARGKK